MTKLGVAVKRALIDIPTDKNDTGKKVAHLLEDVL